MNMKNHHDVNAAKDAKRLKSPACEFVHIKMKKTKIERKSYREGNEVFVCQ